MDNRKKKRNRQKNKPISNDNTKQLNAKPQQMEEEPKSEPKNGMADTASTNEKPDKIENTTEMNKDIGEVRQSAKEDVQKADNQPQKNKTEKSNETEKKDTVSPAKLAEKVRQENRSESAVRNAIMQLREGNIKETALKAAKILLPAAACIIVIAVIVSYIGSQRTRAVDV